MNLTDPSAVISAVLKNLGQRGVQGEVQLVQQHVRRLAQLSDAEVREACLQAHQRVAEVGGPPPRSRALWLRRLLLALLARQAIDPLTRRNIALGVEAFHRAPADLPEGSLLYETQVRTAVALTQGALVEMALGEGKTYAILPAAFALACRYGQVYVVCANEYLAWRDATRTRRYWELVGMVPGLGRTGSSPAEWSRPVIYTTLNALMFKALNDDVAVFRPEWPVRYSAALLDEADAVLLDQSDVPRLLTVPVAGELFDWSFAIAHSAGLVEGETVTTGVQGGSLFATLTPEGEQRLRRALGVQADDQAQYLLYRHAVELAYVATKMAIEGENYVWKDGRAYPVDPTDGNILWNVTEDWIYPIEFARGLPPRSKNIGIHTAWPSTFLKRFDLLAGTSGTIVNEALEYFLSFNLTTIYVSPQFPRQGVRHHDLIFNTREEAYKTLVEEVTGVIPGRPVLIGTQSIVEAQRCHALLRQRLPEPCSLNLLTGEDEREEPSVLEQAGQVGVVTIATQRAGRGVDIRLSGAAREAGGLALFGVAHARQARHDRQFLGRAGRRGDPFDARFICYLDDPFFKLVRAGPIRALMERLELPADEPIENRLIDRGIENAQRDMRAYELRRRRYQALEEGALTEVEEAGRTWFQLAQLTPERGGDGRTVGWQVDVAGPRSINLDAWSFFPDQRLLEWVVNRYIETHVAPALTRMRRLDGPQAELLGATLLGVLGRARGALDVESVRAQLVGRSSEEVLRVSTRLVHGAVVTAVERAWMVLTRPEPVNEPLPPHEHAAWYYANTDMLEELVSSCQDVLLRVEQATEEVSGQPALASGVAPPAGTASIHGEQPGSNEPTTVAAPGESGRDIGLVVPDLADALALEPSAFRSVIERELGLLDARLAAQPSPEASHELHDAARRVLSVAHDYLERASRAASTRINRTPRAAVWATIKLAWADFLRERAAVRYRVSQRNLSIFQHYRMVTDTVMAEWHRREALLAADVLTNLVMCDRPELLDDVFLLEEHQVQQEREPQQADMHPWSTAPVDEPVPPQQLQRRLVRSFLNRWTDRLPDGSLTEADLEGILQDFLLRSPVLNLQSPQHIQRALDDWARNQAQQGVPLRRRKLNREWLVRFLQFLHRQGHIGKLPGPHIRVSSVLQRLRGNLRDRKTALALGGTMVFVAAFAVLSAVARIGRPFRFSPFVTLADELIAGGFIRWRVVTAPAVTGLVLGSALFALMRWPTEEGDRPKGLSGERWMMIALQALVAAWIVGWDGLDSVGSVLSRVALVLLILLLAHVVQGIVWGVELAAAIPLVSAWLCFTTAGVLVPHALGGWQNGWPGGVLSFLAAAGVLATLQALNAEEIPVSSAHVQSADRLAESELVITSYRVDGYPGLRAHVYGILLAWVAHWSLTASASIPSWARQLVPMALYLVVVLVWSTSVLTQRFAPAAWEQLLNQRHQLVDVTFLAGRNVGDVLVGLRRRLLLRHVGITAAIASVLTVLLWNRTVVSTRFPLAVLLLFAAAILAVHGTALVRSLYNILLVRTPFTGQALSLSEEPHTEPAGAKGRALRFARQHLNAVSALGIAASAFISRINGLFELYNNWEKLRDWIGGP
jgi:preprotein translocase subunit SecA